MIYAEKIYMWQYKNQNLNCQQMTMMEVLVSEIP